MRNVITIMRRELYALATRPVNLVGRTVPCPARYNNAFVHPEVPLFRPAHTGVVVIDGPTDDPEAERSRNAPEELKYPTQADILRDEYKDMVLVGRIRDDETVDNGINMWVVADNLRKGAATNVVQIAEAMIERGFFAGKV